MEDFVEQKKSLSERTKELNQAQARIRAAQSTLEFTTELLQEHGCKSVPELPAAARALVRTRMSEFLPAEEMQEGLDTGKAEARYLAMLPESAFGQIQ